jgi:hypothetical protein
LHYPITIKHEAVLIPVDNSPSSEIVVKLSRPLQHGATIGLHQSHEISLHEPGTFLQS